jgi:hypothetical protein
VNGGKTAAQAFDLGGWLIVRRFEPADAEALTRLLHRSYAELGAAGLNFTAVDQDPANTLSRAPAGCWPTEVR